MACEHKLRVMLAFGTRPEAIKMMPLYKACKACTQIETLLCVTAQHRQMLDAVLQDFAMVPDDDLNLMRTGQTLSDITCGVLRGMDAVLEARKPDLVLVHGDTSTAFAAALASFYRRIPVGHVEAGLRSFHPLSPFPEEMNRVMIADMATLHFAPTMASVENLRAEHAHGCMVVTGNTVLDVLRYTVRETYTFEEEALRGIDWTDGRWILLTAHRRENLGAPLAQILRAVRRLLEEDETLHVIYPMHPNPAVSEAARAVLGDCAQALLLPPLDVKDLHNLMQRCTLVMTDSGGLQEEAPSLHKPVLVLRTETERQEVVACGAARLVGVAEDAVYAQAKMLLADGEAYRTMAQAGNPYGDGQAAGRIVEAICAWDTQGRPVA